MHICVSAFETLRFALVLEQGFYSRYRISGCLLFWTLCVCVWGGCCRCTRVGYKHKHYHFWIRLCVYLVERADYIKLDFSRRYSITNTSFDLDLGVPRSQKRCLLVCQGHKNVAQYHLHYVPYVLAKF